MQSLRTTPTTSLTLFLVSRGLPDGTKGRRNLEAKEKQHWPFMFLRRCNVRLGFVTQLGFLSGV